MHHTAWFPVLGHERFRCPFCKIVREHYLLPLQQSGARPDRGLRHLPQLRPFAMRMIERQA
jgi:hypothetical protein